MQYEQSVLRRLQVVELEILAAIDCVCREYGITYFLDSGTVLGARRHGGFIPWDDDIDLGMPRDDYERFLEVAPAALGKRFRVTCSRSNPHQAALFSKVMLVGMRFVTDETEEAGFDQGIFVDIFRMTPFALSRMRRSGSVSAARCGRASRTYIIPSTL